MRYFPPFKIKTLTSKSSKGNKCMFKATEDQKIVQIVKN